LVPKNKVAKTNSPLPPIKTVARVNPSV